MSARVCSSQRRLLEFRDEVLRVTRWQQHTSRACETADCRHVLRARFDERSAHAKLCTKSAPLGGQDVRFGEASGVDRLRDGFGVNRIILSAVLTNPDPSNTRGVEHAWVVPPLRELVVHVPAFSTGLERNASGRRVRPEPRGELRQRSYRRSVDDLAVGHLAIRDVARTQIKSYATHDEPPLGPQPSGNLCL
jgi:hypothetical protein